MFHIFFSQTWWGPSGYILKRTFVDALLLFALTNAIIALLFPYPRVTLLSTSKKWYIQKICLEKKNGKIQFCKYLSSSYITDLILILYSLHIISKKNLIYNLITNYYKNNNLKIVFKRKHYLHLITKVVLQK